MRIWTLAAIVGLLVTGTEVYADGVYIPKLDPATARATHSQDITEPTQKAAILYANGKERMILQVTYKGNVSEFAWLVPTPSRPRVMRVDYAIFHQLHAETAPTVPYWLDAREALRHFPASPIFVAREMARGSDSAGMLKVDVIEEKQVGIYETAVLRAQNSDDLLTWLKQNHYRVNNRLRPVLGDYIRRKWVFTAAKISVGNRKSSAGNLMAGTVQSLAFDFDSRKPVYPLKISSLNAGLTNVLLYVVCDHRVEAPSLRTVCVLPTSRYSALAHVSVNDRDYLEKIWTPLLGTLSRAYLTKLSGNFRTADMSGDLVLTKANNNRLLMQVNSPSFLENLGAVVLMLVTMPFSVPINLILALIVYAGSFLPIPNRPQIMLMVLSLVVVFAFIPMKLLEIYLSDFGYWPVGLTAILAAVVIAVLVLRRVLRRRKATQV